MQGDAMGPGHGPMLHVDPNTGQAWVLAPDGKWVPCAPPGLVRNVSTVSVSL
jgi:hypothetical protein